MQVNRAKRKAAVDQRLCVACGCCAAVCPLGAVAIFKGSFALVDENKCVGCGKCARVCPASVITMEVQA